MKNKDSIYKLILYYNYLPFKVILTNIHILKPKIHMNTCFTNNSVYTDILCGNIKKSCYLSDEGFSSFVLETVGV